MSVKDLIQNADRQINGILTDLEAELKSQGMRVSHVSVGRYVVDLVSQRESDQLFDTEVHIEVRR